METKCFVCGKPVNFDPGMGSSYIGANPHCSEPCARQTLLGDSTLYATPNEHGAYPPEVCEVIEFIGKQKSEAKIMLANIGPDQWIFSTSVRLYTSGWSGYPSHNRDKRYPTRADALSSAITKIIADVERDLKVMHAHEAIFHSAGHEIIRWAQSLRQPKLF